MADKFHLKILGPDEDVPRLLSAYGRGCGGEVALVLCPRAADGVLVHQRKGVPAKVWVADPSALPEGVGAGKPQGDAPREPAWEVGAAEAVTLLKRAKARAPKAGPATLRGLWRGRLRCEGERPVVELERKVASYGVLRVWTTAAGMWMAQFDRAEKWFSRAGQSAAGPFTALSEAITVGMSQTIGMVSEACSFRDTRRRNTVDTEYAQKLPYRPPVEPKDVVERFQPKGRHVAVEGPAGWLVQDERGRVIASFGARGKGKALKHAAALNRGEQPPAPEQAPPQAQPPPAQASAPVADGFGLRGMPGLVVVPALQDVPSPESPACPSSVAKIATATEKEAEALENLSQSLWGTTEAPELLRRAAKLIRHAESLARSPLCTGREQKAALAELRRAAEAYEAARAALGRGDGKEVTIELKRVAERVALAAARAGKACAGEAKKGTKAAPTQKASAAPATDTSKDAVLMDAFTDAIQKAAAAMQKGAA